MNAQEKRKKKKKLLDKKGVSSSLYAAVDEIVNDSNTSPPTAPQPPKGTKDDIVSSRNTEVIKANNYSNPKWDPTPQIKHQIDLDPKKSNDDSTLNLNRTQQGKDVSSVNPEYIRSQI